MPQIQLLDIIAPGAFGLTTERAGQLLKPQWATVALNAVVNRSGRVAARSGFVTKTTNKIASNAVISILHEYVNKAGTSIIITGSTTKVFKDVDDYTDSANDITSSTAPSNPHWQFINFNDKVLGFQRGEVPITWAGSGDFADASYTGTGPDGNCAVAAFGRVWAADADLQTVRYSVLLDETDYSTANGGGTINMSSVWTIGTDRIVAIAAIGANLVVFGENHVIMWADKSGSEVGLDPTDLEIVDVIEGTGCIARDSIQVTGEGDLIFLSRHGVQSLGRVIASKSNPTVTLSRNVRADIMESIRVSRAADSEMDLVGSSTSAEEGLYIINFPTTDEQYVFDLQHPFQDDDSSIVFPITKWILGGAVTALLSLNTGELYFGGAGKVGRYQGFQDDGSSYNFEMKTGWLDFGDQLNHRIKMLKEIIATVVIGNSSAVWNWEFDFNDTILTRIVSYSGGATPALFNISEFSDTESGSGKIGFNDPARGAASGETEFSGTAITQRRLIPAHGEGQFLRLGVTSVIDGDGIVIQHMSIAPKIGRLVT